MMLTKLEILIMPLVKKYYGFVIYASKEPVIGSSIGPTLSSLGPIPNSPLLLFKLFYLPFPFLVTGQILVKRREGVKQ